VEKNLRVADRPARFEAKKAYSLVNPVESGSIPCDAAADRAKGQPLVLNANVFNSSLSLPVTNPDGPMRAVPGNSSSTPM
jgi:hypothetical protein